MLKDKESKLKRNYKIRIGYSLEMRETLSSCKDAKMINNPTNKFKIVYY